MTDETAPDSTENAGYLPGLAPPPPDPGEPGPVEVGIMAQVEKLREDGWITGHHAGQVALAIRTARDVDKSEGKGAPSGRANLLRVMKEILEMLPQPEQAASDALDRALAAMMGTVDVEHG